MFSSKNNNKYILTLAAIFVFGLVAARLKQPLDANNDYEMIRNYLLNDSPLYGYNRPKLWIHSKYEMNARKWKDFYSRNNTDLNQPYLHLTIKTIINHCGADFNICLIDDESFSKLIPSWDVDLATMAEPFKSHFRELGMAQLIYFYGGMTVPNSFVCLKNLKSFYDDGISNNRPFVCESINKTVNITKQKHKMLFIPDLYFMGAVKNNPLILELVEHLKATNKTVHFSNENDFVGDKQQWCIDAINSNKLNLIGGEFIGIKTKDRKTILLDDIMSEEFLNLSSSAVGIYIPEEEVLRRNKYQWFAVMDGDQILKSNMIISKYLAASIVDSTNEYNINTKIHTVVSI
jgi:hypothetical protein